MLIRVRTNVGLWRVDGLDESTATVQSVLDGIAQTRPHVSYDAPLSSDPACKAPLDDAKPLKEQGLGHGAMIHCKVDVASTADAMTQNAAAAAAGGEGGGEDGGQERNEGWSDGGASKNMKRIIGKDGSIQLVHSDEAGPSADRGFRKGMLPLRDMKMQWTLQEFVDMDSKFNFKMQRQEESWVGKGGVSLDTDSANDFQGYLRRFNFQRNRFGLLYGRFVDEEVDEKDAAAKKKDDSAQAPPKNQKVIVEAIYEPPQEADPEAAEGFQVLDDDMEEKAEELASMLGLTRVGWIFGHPPREEGFQLSAAEVIMAAEFQLEAAGGVEPTPFVTVKVTVGDDGDVSFEAFQVSRQCMEMVAEEALEVGPNPGFCVVNDTFTAVQEGKNSKTVENNFFLTVVPIVQHASDKFVSQFPRTNRDHDDRTPSHEEMKRQLSKSGTAGWTFVDLLSDFNLLLYLTKFMDMGGDMPKICQSVVDRDVPLDDGYKIIIASMAGMDGSY